jgi:hypothetical protein
MPTNERPWAHRKIEARDATGAVIERYVLTYRGQDYAFEPPMPESRAQYIVDSWNDLFSRTKAINEQLNDADLRDRFAMAALAVGAVRFGGSPQTAAEWSYQQADAMLAARLHTPTAGKQVDGPEKSLANPDCVWVSRDDLRTMADWLKEYAQVSDQTWSRHEKAIALADKYLGITAK